MDREGEGRLQPFANTEFREAGGGVSSDGRWVTYRSNESGRDEIYVQPFPGGGTKTKISTDGTSGFSRWSPDGKKIYYAARDGMMVVEVTTDGPRLRAGKPSELFPLSSDLDIDDISPDGQRFIALQPTGEDQIAEDREHLHFIFNWFTELHQAP